jgi:hypothetical protein
MDASKVHSTLEEAVDGEVRAAQWHRPPLLALLVAVVWPLAPAWLPAGDAGYLGESFL